MTTTYRLGSLLQGQDAALAAAARQDALPSPRALIRADDGECVGYVSSDAGPATIGPMTRDEVIARFGRDAFVFGRRDDLQTIREFLALPAEALPAACWAEPTDQDAASAWPMLRDAVLPDDEQRMNHYGERIRLHADRPGWDSVIVTV
jgi:hypothetical protein